MNQQQRELILRQKIEKIFDDIEKIEGLLKAQRPLTLNQTQSRSYLERQIGKYLKPYDIPTFLTNLAELKAIFSGQPLVNGNNNDAKVNRPNWNTEGVGEEHVSWTLQLGGGYASYRGMGGQRIRINQKAFWMFPELTLRGVMVHEATHYALNTRDIHYSTFSMNSTLKDLPNGSENADNWRIFYQKVSTQLAS